MSRTSLGLCGVLFLSLASYGCGSDDSSGTDAAASVGNDGGDQSETGSGVGRGRGGGGLEEADAGPGDGPKAQGDAAVADASVPKTDALVKLDAAPEVCEMTKCDEIRKRYQTAVTAAQGCRSTANSQCTVRVASDLGCGGCSVWVNTDASAKVVAKEWTDSGCGNCRYLCPLIACRLLGTGVCQKNGTTAPASVPAVGTIPIIDPGIIVNLNDGMCINKSSVVGQPL